jgi:NADH:ubiquinone oxidoreductase subunit 6 (subunit J)
MTLSMGEDVLAIFLTWMSTRHPYVGAFLVAAFVLAIIVMMRFVVRALRRLLQGVEHELESPGV